MCGYLRFALREQSRAAYLSRFVYRFKRHHARKDVPGPHVFADKQTALWDVRSFPKLTCAYLDQRITTDTSRMNSLSVFLVSLPIVLFTIFTAAAPSNITTSGLSANYECWRPPGVSLVYRDCVELIRHRLGFPHDPTVPMSFSRRQGAMILIPYAKTSPRGNCNVVLGIRGDTLDTEVEKWENIKRVALEIALMCVIHEPHRGGYAWMGLHNNLLVSMIGKDGATGLLRRDGVVVEEDDMTFYTI
ncbi:MAG: hypothetical protein Q9193_003194 [Seirophora villosa]